jgi:hypothetical protein
MMRILFLAIVAIFIGSMLADGCNKRAESAEVQDVRGVIANERVVNLPNDSEKWYLSVVGESGEANYERILAWFEKDSDLRTLKRQVHFREIDSDTAIYLKRYASNVTGLPTVRLQKNNGEVVYEAAGNKLPLTSSGLFGALANSSSKAQGRGIFTPWRTGPRKRLPLRGPGPVDPLDYRCPNGKCPLIPDNSPPEDDPPEAPIDDGGPPDISTKSRFDFGSAGIGAGSALLCLFGGAGLSLLVQWRRKYRQ